MKLLTESQAIDLLKKHAPNEKIFKLIYDHSKAVQKVALHIAQKIPDTNTEFIRTASLLHDIGRFIAGPGKKGIQHGIKGGEILRNLGYEEYARVCERHIGAGISKKEIIEQDLPLPKEDYLPKTVEEKIITHADNLVFGKRIGTFEEVIQRYEKEIGSAEKFVTLEEDLNKLSN